MINLRKQLEEMLKIAQRNLSKAQQKQKQYLDQKSREVLYSPGDQVSLLPPFADISQ